MIPVRIQLRNAVLALVEDLPGFGAENVVAHKLDKVEIVPIASVYLGDLSNERGAFGGQMDRTQDISISFFIGEEDAEARLSELVDALESSVEQSRVSGLFGEITDVFLSGVEFSRDKTSEGHDVDAHVTFSFSYSEII